MKRMSVYTATCTDGSTRVTMMYGFEHMTVFFTTRHDAAVFLQALRKRER